MNRSKDLGELKAIEGELKEKLQKTQELFHQEVERIKAQEAAAEAERLAEEKRLAKIAKQDDTLRDVRRNMQYFKDKAGDLIYEPEFIWLILAVIFQTKDESRVRPWESPFFENLLEAYLREKENVKHASKNSRNKAQS